MDQRGVAIVTVLLATVGDVALAPVKLPLGLAQCWVVLEILAGNSSESIQGVVVLVNCPNEQACETTLIGKIDFRLERSRIVVRDPVVIVTPLEHHVVYSILFGIVVAGTDTFSNLLDFAVGIDSCLLGANSFVRRPAEFAAWLCAIWVFQEECSSVEAKPKIDHLGADVVPPEEVECLVDFCQVGVGIHVRTDWALSVPHAM